MPEPTRPNESTTTPGTPGTPNAPAAGDASLSEVREIDGALVLVKGAQRYIFRCEPGREHELLMQLPRQVADPESQLDWFDAAVLSHALGQRLHRQLKAG